MLRGLSVDKAANGHFLIKASDKIGMKTKDFIDLAVDQHDELADEVQLEISKSESRDTVSRLSDLYHKTHGKNLVPKSEESIQVKLVGDMGMQDQAADRVHEYGFAVGRSHPRFPLQVNRCFHVDER